MKIVNILKDIGNFTLDFAKEIISKSQEEISKAKSLSNDELRENLKHRNPYKKGAATKTLKDRGLLKNKD